jgi:hypothetical protein
MDYSAGVKNVFGLILPAINIFLPAPAEHNVFNKHNKCYFELQRSDISQGASKKLKTFKSNIAFKIEPQKKN